MNNDIKFTCEIENDGQLPYLDLMLKRKSDGYLSFKIYRKPTNTENYLKFNSNHPLNQKRAVIKSLIYRAEKLCSEENLQEEEENIIRILSKNEYPE